MQIILDISANTHKNSADYYRNMILTIALLDNRKHTVTIKGQLFMHEGQNRKQDFGLFERMAQWTFKETGYKTTASVFDKTSLQLLLATKLPYDLPFIKIANRRDLDWLIGEIPRKVPVYRSGSSIEELYPDKEIHDYNVQNFACISKYPATLEDYEEAFGGRILPYAISDHTIGLDLVKKYKPRVYECHFVLEHNPSNPDAGLWAKTPEQLKEIMEL